jgi:hypothetical protein
MTVGRWPRLRNGSVFYNRCESLEPGGLRISHRWFEPGARTAWLEKDNDEQYGGR